MKPWTYHNPVTVYAGAGQLTRLREWISTGCWLLITTDGFTRRGLTKKIQQSLPDVQLHVYDQVTPNPEVEDLELIIERYRTQKLDGILALGGGSVIDTAKIVSVTLPCNLKYPLIKVLRQGKLHTWEKKLPLIAIPTTSGTGAEVTPFATVWDTSEHRKYSITGNFIFPDKAILDPELTLTLPETETLYTGLDTISHALESLWNINRTPVTTSLAIQALELAIVALPLALHSPNNFTARSDMQNASLLAGLAISQTRTAIAHSISYPLTSHYGVPHGLACSFTLPALISHYLSEFPECSDRALLLRTQIFLLDLNLASRLAKYVDIKEITALKNEMYHPDRSANFTSPITNKVLTDILS